MKKLPRILIFILAGLLTLCLLAAFASALSNVGLPTQQEVVDRLSDLEKVRLGEAVQLREELGGRVWPGWDKPDIPVILYNDQYAFLVGYQDPPPGWRKVPGGDQRGGPWEVVPGNRALGKDYYRQRLSEPEITPEAFTVQVGDRWVAAFQTRDYAQVSLIQGFRKTLPGPLKPIFPYRLLWRLLMGDTETYLGALLHEAFHAYQGMAAPGRLEQAEESMRNASRYPWEDPVQEEAWQAELSQLYQAAMAGSDEQAAQHASRFLELRGQRREKGALSPVLVDLERQREWEEGLAKYAELEIQRQAALAKDYRPLPGLAEDPDFKEYKTRLGYWSNQLSEVQRMGRRSEDTRFYYSGFAQAVVLDRLAPGWKTLAFEPEVWLEDLLRQAIPGR